MRIALVSVAVAALLAGGCAGGDGVDADDEPSGGATTGSTRDDAEAPGGATTTPPGAPGHPPPSTAGSGGHPTAAPGAAPTTAGSGAPGGQGSIDGNVEVGQLAPAVLRPDRSSRVVVEVLAQEGAQPRASTVDHVADVLRRVTDKPVDSVSGGVLGGARTWSDNDMRAAADAAARTPQGNGTAVLRLLFLRGEYEDEDVLGISVRGDTAAVLVDEVSSASTPLVSASVIEDAVTMHEVGHLLGLVDLYLRTGRADPEHPGHSPNRGSVMYWGVESSLVAQILDGPPPRDFDRDDLADLARIRAGG